MTRHELTRATELLSDLRRVERDRDALAKQRVVGITVDCGEGQLNPNRIGRAEPSGTGSISSISWTDDLQADMTQALHLHFDCKVKALRGELERMGVMDLGV